MENRSRLDRYQNLRNDNQSQQPNNQFGGFNNQPQYEDVMNNSRYDSSNYDSLLKEHEDFLRDLGDGFDQNNRYGQNQYVNNPYNNQFGQQNYQSNNYQNQYNQNNYQQQYGYNQFNQNPYSQNNYQQQNNMGLNHDTQNSYTQPQQNQYFQPSYQQTQYYQEQPVQHSQVQQPVQSQVNQYQPQNDAFTRSFEANARAFANENNYAQHNSQPAEPTIQSQQSQPSFDYNNNNQTQSYNYSNIEQKPFASTFEQPTYQQPVAAQPAYSAPAVEQQPAYSAPAFEQPTYQQPVAAQPAYSAPVVEQQPTYSAPAFEQPTYQQPVAAQPAYSAPVVEQQPVAAQPTYSTLTADEKVEEYVADNSDDINNSFGYIDDVLKEFSNSAPAKEETYQQPAKETALTYDDIANTISNFDLENDYKAADIPNNNPQTMDNVSDSIDATLNDFVSNTPIEGTGYYQPQPSYSAPVVEQQPTKSFDSATNVTSNEQANIDVLELTASLEKEKIANQELLEKTIQLDYKVAEYESELNDVNTSMSKTNKILNLILTILILALFVILFVIAFWFAQDRGLF